MTDPKKVKVGDVMTVLHYVKVEKVGKGTIHVRDLDTGIEFDVNGDPLLERMASADQFSKVERLGKTDLAQKLVELWNKPVTVCFFKQDNTERVLRGRLASSEHLLGRSMMEDLDLDKNDASHRLRQVDHRTIKYIITDGVKYEVKK